MKELSLQQAVQVSGGVASDIQDGEYGDFQNSSSAKGYDEGYNDALFDVALGFFLVYLPVIV